MQHVAASLCRSIKLVQRNFINNIDGPPLKLGTVIQARLLDNRSYATTVVDSDRSRYSSESKVMGSKEEVLRKLRKKKEWLGIYDNEEAVQENFKDYSAMRAIYEDTQIGNEQRKSSECSIESIFFEKKNKEMPLMERYHSFLLIVLNIELKERRKCPQVQQDNQALDKYSSNKEKLLRNKAIGENISAKDKIKFLLNMLFNLKDSKEAVYGALDAWVAWERSFPLVSLKRMLITLEKEEQWHRVIQVIKWMLSKGQGTTMGTYGQLIRALEKDHRAEEAHKIWVKKIGHDLHSVPWRVCDLMISIYYRNNMLERLVKLFKGLESFDRKPPSKLIVQKVADAYEMLGLLEEKNQVLEKYSGLFCKSTREHPRKSRKALRKSGKKEDGTGEKLSESLEDGSGGCAENV